MGTSVHGNFPPWKAEQCHGSRMGSTVADHGGTRSLPDSVKHQVVRGVSPGSFVAVRIRPENPARGNSRARNAQKNTRKYSTVAKTGTNTACASTVPAEKHHCERNPGQQGRLSSEQKEYGDT